MIKEIAVDSIVAYDKEVIKFYEVSGKNKQAKAYEVAQLVTTKSMEGYYLESISYSYPANNATLKFRKIGE